MPNDRNKASARSAGTKPHIFAQTGRSNLHTERNPKLLQFSTTQKKKKSNNSTRKVQEIGRIHLDCKRGEDEGCHRQTDNVGISQWANIVGDDFIPAGPCH